VPLKSRLILIRWIVYDLLSVFHTLYHFEIFDVEEYRDFEIWVASHSACEFMHDLYISETYRFADSVDKVK